MTTDPQPPPDVAALVDAIDARARQAGNEGATAVMQRMLGSVTDVLGAIQDRLDQLEDTLASDVGAGGGGGGAVVDAVQSGLATFNARLARLEEAFVQALDESGSGTVAVVDEVRTVVTRAIQESGLVAALDERLGALEQRLVEAVQPGEPQEALADLSTLDLGAQLAPLHDRLAGVEQRMVDTPRDVTTSLEAAFEVVQVRMAGLEQLLRDRANGRVDVSAAVRSAMAPVLERVDALDAASRAVGARTGEGVGRVEAALAALPDRLASLEERVSAAVVSSVSEGLSSPVDPEVLARLEAAVERLDRDEASARLVKLVEDRLSSGLRAVTDRTDEVRRSVEQLAKAIPEVAPDDGALDDVVASLRALQSATGGVADEVSAAIGSRLVPFGDRLAGLDDRLDALHELIGHPVPAAPDHTETLVRITRSLDALSDRVERLADPSVALAAIDAAVDALSDRVAELAGRPAPAPPSVPDPSEALARIDDRLEALSTRVAELAAHPPTEPPDVSGLLEQLNGAVRREAELLTQRVAALAVGVEASRVLLEQQLQDAEHSIGRKAGEVTRRLAADFGIKSRRNGPGGRRDPRELGSG